MSTPENLLQPTNKVMDIYGTPRRSKTKAPRHTTELSEFTSTSDANHVTKTPSIIGLQNLKIHGPDYFTVGEDNTAKPLKSDNSVNKRLLKPVELFRTGNRPKSEKSKVKVYVTVVFLKLGEIETIKEYFEADVYIQAKWREPLLDKPKKTEETEFEQLWNPEIVIQNVVDEPKTTVWHEIQHDRKGHAYVYEMRRVRGKFFEIMELNDFPFDIQSITLVISSELTKDEIEIVEDKSEISAIHVECFSDSQEWELHDFVEIDPLDISSQYTKASQSYPGILATCCVSRRAGFFAWNVLLIVNLLNIFAFTTFSVAPTLPQNRLQLSFILILSAISFRFVTNQSIPKISYLTHLDLYVLTSMVFCGFITFWHAILTRFSYDSDLQNKLDFYVFIIFAVAYLIFQIAFIVAMIYQRWRKLKEMRGKEEKYKFKANGIMGDMWGTIRSSFAGIGNRIDRRVNALTGRRYPHDNVRRQRGGATAVST